MCAYSTYVETVILYQRLFRLIFQSILLGYQAGCKNVPCWSDFLEPSLGAVRLTCVLVSLSRRVSDSTSRNKCQN